MPITRRYPLSGGKPAGELRLSGPQQTKWFHGTNDVYADSIVRSQRLHGDGDFGGGGYLANTVDEALDWTHTSPEDYRQTRERRDYPAVVEAELRPKRPLYGQKPVDRMINAELLRRMGGPIHPDMLHGEAGTMGQTGYVRSMPHASSGHVMNSLKDKYDVWFPLGRSPKHPGMYAVILDDNAGLSAQFTKRKLHRHEVWDYDEDDDDDWG